MAEVEEDWNWARPPKRIIGYKAFTKFQVFTSDDKKKLYNK